MSGAQSVQIIALAGSESSGRRTIARMLADDFRVPTLCVGAEIRSALLAADPLVGTQVALSDLVRGAGWESALGSRLHGGEISALLRHFDRGVRSVAGEDVWLRAALGTAVAGLEDSSVPVVCLWDLSRADEARWVREQGGQVWAVRRPGADGSSLHSVPDAVCPSLADALIENSGTRTALRRRVAELASAMGLHEVARARPLVSAAHVEASALPSIRALRAGAL